MILKTTYLSPKPLSDQMIRVPLEKLRPRRWSSSFLSVRDCQRPPATKFAAKTQRRFSGLRPCFLCAASTFDTGGRLGLRTVKAKWRGRDARAAGGETCWRIEKQRSARSGEKRTRATAHTGQRGVVGDCKSPLPRRQTSRRLDRTCADGTAQKIWSLISRRCHTGSPTLSLPKHRCIQRRLRFKALFQWLQVATWAWH